MLGVVNFALAQGPLSGQFSVSKTISRRYREKSIEYDIVGAGPLRADLEALIYQLGAERNIRLLGERPHEDVKKLMMRAHLFLLPSVTANNGDQEGVPVSLMEAMATGMPVLSTFHSGIPELVHDGDSGFLVPERDVSALVEKLEYLIKHAEIWPIMGRNGRTLIEKNHNVDKLNDRLVTIYRSLLAGEGPYRHLS